MRDLIERLEKATGPDRELDLVIAKRFNTYRLNTSYMGPDDPDWTEHFPEYTASIDAALTLVPDGFRHAFWHHHSVYLGAEVFPDKGGGPMHKGHDAKTPAIALCIAAMKAREEMEGKE